MSLGKSSSLSSQIIKTDFIRSFNLKIGLCPKNRHPIEISINEDFPAPVWPTFTDFVFVLHCQSRLNWLAISHKYIANGFRFERLLAALELACIVKGIILITPNFNSINGKMKKRKFMIILIDFGEFVLFLKFGLPDKY